VFVERKRRALEKIERETVAPLSGLAELTSREMIAPDYGGDSCNLWFRTNDRSCGVGYYAYEDVPDVSFYWDECLQFRVRTEDTLFMAELLKRWLCDNVMPSAIKQEFPSVALSDLAQYYEQGRGIEGEFIESWCHAENFYERVQRPFASQVLEFISQLRAAGYDQTLRAGTSLYTLLVSRSRRHGLRPTQPYIAFSFGGAPFTGRVIATGEMVVTVCLDGGERRIAFPSLEWSAGLSVILQQLEAKAID
jgi:hypothetical protein